MDFKEKFNLLKQNDLLNSFAPETLKALAETSREIVLRPNEVLFEEGSRQNSMYLILRGELLVFKGPKIIAHLGSGQYLGEMSLIESKKRSASAKAVTKTILMEITEEQFHAHFSSEPKALFSIMRTLSQRIRTDLDTMVNDYQKLSLFTHDIKNNLTPLELAELNYAALIQRFEGEKEAHKKRRGLDELEQSIHILKSVRDNLLTMVDASLLHIKKRTVEYAQKKSPLVPLIEETIREISSHSYLEGKQIRVHASETDLEPFINALDIKRVLQNLILNAGHVTPDGGQIDISVHSQANDIQVSVSDKGCGVAEEAKPFLFKESFSTKKDGVGLGLLSCREIIEDLHRGKVWYESEKGQGTTFHFTVARDSEDSE